MIRSVDGTNIEIKRSSVEQIYDSRLPRMARVCFLRKKLGPLNVLSGKKKNLFVYCNPTDPNFTPDPKVIFVWFSKKKNLVQLFVSVYPFSIWDSSQSVFQAIFYLFHNSHAFLYQEQTWWWILMCLFLICVRVCVFSVACFYVCVCLQSSFWYEIGYLFQMWVLKLVTNKQIIMS